MVLIASDAKACVSPCSRCTGHPYTPALESATATHGFIGGYRCGGIGRIESSSYLTTVVHADVEESR
jgi:hypothetical protein